MKTLLLLVLSFCSMVALAADAIPEFDIYDLGTKSAGLEGQVIKVKFAHRDGNMLVGYKGRNMGKMRAEVPVEGQTWFNAISTQVSKTSSLSAYAKVEGNHLALVGRDLRDGIPVW